ncbi:hypothetical protein [Oceanospirillum maris]|jgi:hypothetical protein|nr:hypothetical protein [Oceanospirillum maris]
MGNAVLGRHIDDSHTLDGYIVDTRIADNTVVGKSHQAASCNKAP